MDFTAEGIGVGLLAGWGSAYLVYRSRHGMARVIGQARGGAASASMVATQRADRRYVQDLLARIDASGMLGGSIPLSSVLIEPRFIPGQSRDVAAAELSGPDLYSGVPIIHDFPAFHAPYNLETITVRELSTGSPALVLLGLPGSGRTTALMAIALFSLGQLNVPTPPDKLQARLDKEEAELTEKERAVRVKERVLTEQRAKERLDNERPDLAAREPAPETAGAGGPLTFNQRVPLYLHLAEILSDAVDFSGGADPAEPLVRAVQASVGRITASTLPRDLYRWLNQGLVLALLDGYDELSPSDQARACAWLKAFRAQYERTFVIVSAGVNGHGPLLDLGLTPVHMRPWTDQDVLQAADRSAAAVSSNRGKNAPRPPDTQARERAVANTRALSVAEVTMKIAANYGGKVDVPGAEGWLRAALAPLIPADQTNAAATLRLAKLGALQLDEGVITADRMVALSIDGQKGPATDDTPLGSDDKAQAAAKSTSDQARLLHTLERSGLLLDRGNGRYQFRHVLFASYFASLYLKNADLQTRQARLHELAWRSAFAYLALHSPVDDLVRQCMTSAQDLLHVQALEVGRWIACAPAGAAWRGAALRTLGNWFAAPSQFPLLRERVAAALVTTRDPSVLVVFRQGARSPNPAIRRLSCLGMGALANPEAVRDLRPLVQDRDETVSLAAAMGMGAVGGEESLEELVIAFTRGSEAVRQAVAESLAMLPDDGYPVLYEAVQDDDMMLRRAAIFGLRRIRVPWAIIAIYRTFLEDEQWYVRSAAQQAFEELQYGRSEPLLMPLPQPAEMDWLTLWAAHRGESIPAGPAGIQMLVRVLQEGDHSERALAALNLGSLGVLSGIRPLYGALRDRQDSVRAAAFRALGTLQERTNIPIPLPA